MTIFNKEIFENKKKKYLNNAESERINHLYANDFDDVEASDIEIIQRHEYNKALSDLVRDLVFELNQSEYEIQISEILDELINNE